MRQTDNKKEELLRAAIKGILNEYGCLHSDGKLWDKVTEELRNEELITRLLMLHKIKKNE